MSEIALLSRITVLENELRSLREISAIENLRYKYWFAIVDKDVDALVSCFADDAHLEYGFGIELDGVDAIREFFAQLLGNDELIHQIPRGTNRNIQLISDVSASGRWLVEVTTSRKPAGSEQAEASRVSVQYFERYRKTKYGWRLSYMKNDYFGFENVALQDSPL